MADLIYYNASLFNNTGAPIHASLNDTRSQAILKCACDYKCSIIRFSVNGSLLPLLIPRILATGPFVVTGYSVALSYSGSTYTQQVIFNAPQNNQIQYAYYSFSAFVSDINEAFRQAAIGLLALQPTLPAVAPNPPILIWDPLTQFYTIYFNVSYVNNVTISMNYDLYNLFESYQAVFNGYNTPNGRDYDLILSDYNTIRKGVAPADYPLAINAMTGPIAGLTQEFQSLSQFTAVQSIFFTSYQIPVNNENLPVKTGIGQNVNFSNATLPIVTDFSIALGLDSEFLRGQTLYNPTAQYRYLTLQSETSLNTIDLQCFWTDRQGVAYPFLLDIGYYISVKLLFEKLK
jgi:hypothetical protein